MTCEDVRDRLPEHALGTLEGADELAVRRHLRSCASCRAELASLGDGLSMFASAAHDRTPPPELMERVLGVIEDEWRDTPSRAPASGRRWQGLAVAAAVLALVASLAWGMRANQRATIAARSEDSYQTLLTTLGGKDFRVGKLTSTGTQPLEGSVVLYDSHVDQSWGLVLVRAPGMSGTADASLVSADGRSIKLRPIEFDPDGDGATWLVASSDLTAFHRLTLTSPDGSILATATITPV